MDAYYISKNDKQVGPFTVEDITGKVGRGSLDRGDLCWKEGMEEWEPIQKHITLPPPPPAGSLPPPPMPGNSAAQNQVKVRSGLDWLLDWPQVWVLPLLFMVSVFVFFIAINSIQPYWIDGLLQLAVGLIAGFFIYTTSHGIHEHPEHARRSCGLLRGVRLLMWFGMILHVFNGTVLLLREFLLNG